MSVQNIIKKKRDGNELDPDEIRWAVDNYVSGEIPDYQMAALLMAICLKGMTQRETVNLTQAMIASGDQAEFGSSVGFRVDKHSTGGVGDKASLIIAPLVASLGVPVPMMSGRGLGHTGGTLDKLESIPGFQTDLNLHRFQRQVEEIGCAFIGQSEEIVPADRKLYALRDATGTVQSVPLICSSILSKKVAEGSNALLLDVKFGRGAVYQDISEARELAQNLVTIGENLGLKITALLTDMNQPLGRAVGNWIEVKECLDVLTGSEEPEDLVELSLSEAAMMIVLAGKAGDYSEARGIVQESFESGRGFDKFSEIVQWQNGDIGVIENYTEVPNAQYEFTMKAVSSGYINEVDALVIGQAAMNLGAGRMTKEDGIDHKAGIYLHKKRGDQVSSGDPLLSLYASTEEKLDAVVPDLESAFDICADPPEERPLILSKITTKGEERWEG
ncbi:thymidine phosphorylase [candidate division LCP-89 bacterium B3_LCP]|uniref:thymidine phosphorylase n=1 Tax=candidate division LCP-89 bacterium B3_LCP TaxID=2012998 RepID=A0A532UU03_UNCL8|nr:MAG: thymidine phosphorylase [candidate division LCP-89 bacterium B3_LCP]